MTYDYSRILESYVNFQLGLYKNQSSFKKQGSV